MEVDHDATHVHSTAQIETLQRPHSSSDIYSSLELQSDRAPAIASGAGNLTDINHSARTVGGLYVGRTNPRGGTSISSSLLPIRPDSEDEDEEGVAQIDILAQGRLGGQETDMGHGQRAVGELRASQLSGTEIGEGAGERRPRGSRPSRFPPPEIVADLIQEQIVQGIAEAAATSASRTSPIDNIRETLVPQPPPLPLPDSSRVSLEAAHNSTAGESFREGTTSTNSRMDDTLGDSPFTRRGTRIHRRRLRSSSLRGLLGFQPVNGATSREESMNSSFANRTNPEQSNGQPASQGTQDQRRFVETQLPFFARLLVEFGRSLRGSQSQSMEGNPVASGSPTLESSTAGIVIPPSEDITSIHLTDNQTPMPGQESVSLNGTPSSATSPTSEANVPSRPRRHTTIRFIQIGGSGGLAAFGSRRPRSGSVTSGQGSPTNEQSENPSNAARDELADAILMFLGNPGSGSTSDGDSSETTAVDNGEASRSRPRRSPWVVFTLSGAYLSSLLAGAGEGSDELGMSYDELWMLSNLIGPAQPVTTTQEAIDNAGFYVGQFENASQGMRDYDMLGDGSKCLLLPASDSTSAQAPIISGSLPDQFSQPSTRKIIGFDITLLITEVQDDRDTEDEGDLMDTVAGTNIGESTGSIYGRETKDVQENEGEQQQHDRPCQPDPPKDSTNNDIETSLIFPNTVVAKPMVPVLEETLSKIDPKIAFKVGKSLHAIN
ncbi:hypothetical protein BGX27_000033 [Mortierella sp. AM989]|nr:hypothetical protein BGX27_000033 [Mortierella sp. AM989]